MMISKRLLTGFFAAAMLAAGSAHAQFYLRVDGAASKTVTANFKDNSTNGFLISGNDVGTAAGQFNDFGTGVALSAGAGTRFAPNGRADITATYRKYKLDQADAFNPPTHFKADIDSLAVMGNLYFEFTESGVRPYVGFGLGGVLNKLGDLKFDDGIGFSGTVPGDTHLGVAVAGMFGFGFPIGGRLSLDLFYRYVDLGDVQTKRDQPLTAGGITANYGGASGHLRVHELAVGLRF